MSLQQEQSLGLSKGARQLQLLSIAGQDIEQDFIDYQGLQHLMQLLHAQLLARDCEHIELINQQITVLLAVVRERAERRTKILGALRLGQSQGAMANLFTLYPESQGTQLIQRWHELERLVQDTKAQNERNGKLLAMHNEILGQIMGHANSAPVYSAQYY